MIGAHLEVANGVASFQMNYLRKLDPQKVMVDFALLFDRETPYADEIKERGGRIFILPPISKIKEHAKACKKILDEGNYQIIHDNSTVRTIPMMWYAKKKKIPVRILHSHNAQLGGSKQKEIINRVVIPLLRAQANEFLACSELAGQALFGKRAFKVIPNVIDSESDVNKFDLNCRIKTREKFKVTNKFVVITVGRISQQKNPFFAIDVFAHVAKKMPESEYWWVGGGAQEQELKEYAEKKELKDKVKFLGARTDVKDLYQAADCFFLPSLFEGLPVTAIEAQAFGLPCVLSDSITKELVYTNLVEYVDLKDSYDIWASAIIRKKESENNRGCYWFDLRLSQFSSDKAGENLTRYYEKVLKKRQ